MKKTNITNLLLFTLFLTQLSFSQRVTLNEFENICNKTNWESVNAFLMSEGWEYYESNKGDSEKYNTITWSFNKSYNDEAEAWFYLYTYEGFPNKISYSVFNKSSYSAIHNSLSSKGYKLENSTINDNELISTYTNSKFILKITTEKREKDTYSRYDKSLTAYNFLLIKKSSVYDPDNGKKTQYYDGGTKKAEYTLVNGKINGSLLVYHENGQIKRKGQFKNGLAQGKFFEYDENGNKTYDYIMLDDEKNGAYNFYENGKISYTTFYKDDLQNGLRTEYYYDEESGELNLKFIGKNIDNKKDGTWKLIYLDKEDGEKILNQTTYSNGLKNGFSQDVQGDSLILANYANDKLHGDYKVYRDLTKMIFGGMINTDTTKLALISKGKYINDNKTGHWKNYNFAGTISTEGNYYENLKSGEWKYYFSKYINENGEPKPYSEKLFLIENFKEGKLDGQSTRYGYLNDEKYACSELDSNNKPLDSCTRKVYTKVYCISNYKNDKLNGLYEARDSLSNLVSRGNFKNGKKNGEWVHHYTEGFTENTRVNYIRKGAYSEDLEHGEWNVFLNNESNIARTMNYYRGELDGKWTEWKSANKPEEVKVFRYGDLKQLIVYDSLGISPIREYKILPADNSERRFRYRCKFTIYDSKGKISQVYNLKKEDEINHFWFDFNFLTKLNNNDEKEIYMDGDHQVYNAIGKPIVLGKYIKEYKISKWTYFYYSQNVKVEIKYEQNENIAETYLTLDDFVFSGDFVYTNQDENIKEIRSIKDGLRDGKTEYIDLTTGKTVRKEKYKDGVLK